MSDRKPPNLYAWIGIGAGLGLAITICSAVFYNNIARKLVPPFFLLVPIPAGAATAAGLYLFDRSKEGGSQVSPAPSAPTPMLIPPPQELSDLAYQDTLGYAQAVREQGSTLLRQSIASPPPVSYPFEDCETGEESSGTIDLEPVFTPGDFAGYEADRPDPDYWHSHSQTPEIESRSVRLDDLMHPPLG